MKKALLIGVGKNIVEMKESLLELENLALLNAIVSVDKIVQRSSSKDKKTYVKIGKLKEIKDYLLNNKEITYLIFNDELSNNQLRNIDKELNLDYITISDRTILIFDIFIQRAKTKTAINQIEIAKLQYQLAHLVLSDENYDQQRGESGLINRGRGEKKIVSQRRTIKNKIHTLRQQIEKDVMASEERRKQRSKNDLFEIALVGYTNAGKSTLLNNLINDDKSKKVFEKDLLFATLDTSVRKLNLVNNRKVLISDTVGFIDRLPHNLIASFKSTLIEAVNADLILHVVDYNNPNYQKHIEVSDKTLEDIGINKETKVIYIYNKMDLIDPDYEFLLTDNIIKMSSRNKDDINRLKIIIQNYLFEESKDVFLKIDYNDKKMLNQINKLRDFKVIESDQAGMIVKVYLSKKEQEYYKKYLID